MDVCIFCFEVHILKEDKYTPLSTVLDVLIFFQIFLPASQTVGTVALWDQPKHPVAIFTEYCTKNGLDLSFVITDEPEEIGYFLAICCYSISCYSIFCYTIFCYTIFCF